MIILPMRALPLVFAATEYVTIPLPIPLPPDVMVIQVVFLTAVHLHPLGAVTVTLPLPPLAVKSLLVGEIE